VNATQKLLEKWISRRAVVAGADMRHAAMALELGIKPTSIGNYLSGFSQAAPHVIAKMARDLGENELAWISLVESERARDAADRKVWARLARSLGMAACLTVAVLGTLPAKAEAVPSSRHYAKLRRRVVTTASTLLRGWFLSLRSAYESSIRCPGPALLAAVV